MKSLLLFFLLAATKSNVQAVQFTFRQPMYMFFENVGSGQVCVDKSGITEETIRVRISGALQAELNRTFIADLEFPPTVDENCSLFPIRDNQRRMEETEVLMFSLSIIDPGNGTELGQYSTIMVSILDDDGVTVGFMSESYTTSEDEGGVEVCVAVLAGEASNPISLTVVTTDGTATSPDDYTATFTELVVNSTTRVCVSVPIVTDNAVEGIENFTAVLFNNASEDDLRITLEPQHASIIIMDTSTTTTAPIGTSTTSRPPQITTEATTTPNASATMTTATDSTTGTSREFEASRTTDTTTASQHTAITVTAPTDIESTSKASSSAHPQLTSVTTSQIDQDSEGSNAAAALMVWGTVGLCFAAGFVAAFI